MVRSSIGPAVALAFTLLPLGCGGGGSTAAGGLGGSTASTGTLATTTSSGTAGSSASGDGSSGSSGASGSSGSGGASSSASGSGGASTASSTSGAGGASTASSTSSAGTGQGGASAASSSSSEASSASASSSSGGATVPDPNVDGPYTYAEIDDTMNVAATGDTNIAIHCAYPTAGPTAGPYPVVIVAHGLDLAATEYYGYVQRLASFGYVALTVDYPASVFSVDNTTEAQDLLAGIDWAGANATVGGLSDTSTAGMTGHSLGGKLALLAATMDARVKASITLDPVDGGEGSCTAPDCIEVGALMPSLQIPTGFVGETTDATGGVFGMPCAPAADNYTTFYAQTNSPSLEVTALGADHMSFLDDEASCGVVCDLCTAGTAPNAQVVGMAHAYVAAFYERWIRGNTGYDTYLTGAEAQARYVATAEATITSK